jgi:hypothetical protein
LAGCEVYQFAAAYLAHDFANARAPQRRNASRKFSLDVFIRLLFRSQLHFGSP